MTDSTANLLYVTLCSVMLFAWVMGFMWRQRRGVIGGLRPLALLVPLGVLVLFLGLQNDLPPAVGIGVAFVLLGEYLPWSYRRAPRRRLGGLGLRLSPATLPELPDLELQLESGGATVRNVGHSPLVVHGWSPTSVNAWWPARDARAGEPLTRLAVGRQARLSPWPSANCGVRIWYRREGEPQTLLFRADWPGEGVERVLN